ncbi:MAG TPA: 4-hydroxy-tetrahydrodipicolinate reductase [Burkholderiales bacterium]|nr:4-hydroxy-tetrahydrodipicolinate reductase [Burkholderiales bacterium]
MKIAIAGAGGRMGRTLVDAVAVDGELSLVVAVEMPKSPALGTPAGAVKITSDLTTVASADVVLDFTRPEGTLALLKHAKAMVIGTTGFTEEDKDRIAEAAKRIPIIVAANFAVGVNTVYKLAETAARILGDAYDVEIVEAHHRHKVDAPSGTALQLGQVVARALERPLQPVHGRKGDVRERTAKEIGFHSIRGGDIVGEHTVIFAGIGERVEVTVRSQSRLTYANGALRAAKWLQGRPPGLYAMSDVLGL